MRPHDDVRHYCSHKELSTGIHGSHYIVYHRSEKPYCGRCKDNGDDATPTERCKSPCGECDQCEPCKREIPEGNGHVEKPTLEEYKSAIPYTADILDIFKR